MADEDVIVKKLDEIGDQVKHVQDTNDRLQKQYDGLDATNIKEVAENAAKGLEEVQEIKQKLAAMDYKTRLDAIELAIARNGGADSKNPEMEKRYKKSMLNYLRKGTPIDDEMLDVMCKSQVEMELLGAGDPEKINYLQKDLVAASGPDGGYFIIPDRSTSISTRIFETSPLRPVANTVTTTSDIWFGRFRWTMTSLPAVGSEKLSPDRRPIPRRSVWLKSRFMKDTRIHAPRRRCWMMPVSTSRHGSI